MSRHEQKSSDYQNYTITADIKYSMIMHTKTSTYEFFFFLYIIVLPDFLDYISLTQTRTQNCALHI